MTEQGPDGIDIVDRMSRAENLSDVLRSLLGPEDFEAVDLAIKAELPPNEIVGFMNRKRLQTKDFAEFNSWSEALRAYVDTLADADLDEEARVIKCEFISNEIACAIGKEGYPNINRMFDAKFELSIDGEEADRLRKLPEFVAAKECLWTPLSAIGIGNAIAIIKNCNLDETTKASMLEMIDVYTERLVVERALSRFWNGIDRAVDAIDKLGSSDGTKARMRLCLDKYVFEKAKDDFLKGNRPGAFDLIIRCASTPERGQEMNCFLREFVIPDDDL